MRQRALEDAGPLSGSHHLAATGLLEGLFLKHTLEDPDDHRAVLDVALLRLTPPWQELGVLEKDQRLTQRGAWGLLRALHRAWSDNGRAAGQRGALKQSVRRQMTVRAKRLPTPGATIT